MQIDVICGPGNAAAKVRLSGRESVTAEAGSMIAMSGDMTIKTTTHKKTSGGVFKGLKRMLAGESFFLNHFTASESGGDVFLAPTLPGDLLALTLDSNLVVQSGSYLASSAKVEVDLSWQGMKSMFSGESLFWLKLSGEGQVVLSSFGAIYAIDVENAYIVDSGHVVAFQDTLKFSITKVGKSWLSSYLGGEGLVMKFQGKGRLWCQSHSPSGFGQQFGLMLRPREG